MLADITLKVPSTIEFGLGKIATLKDHLKSNRRVFFLVDAPVVKEIEPLLRNISEMGIKTQVSSEVVPEPPIESLEKLLKPVAQFNPDAVVGIGGGSTMDLAKLASVLFNSAQKTEDIIGIDKVQARSVKLITATTTAGTGSEVTPIAVLTDTEAGLKKGVVSKHIVPDVAIVDPALTITMPPALTAVTGMDAITHCIEAYTNRFAHPVIDTLALEGVKLMFRNLEQAVVDGNNLEARSAMALGSLYGGLCLGPVNTAAVHALAYPLGGLFKVSHGTSNSVLLPFVMKFNLPSCTARYADIARALGLDGAQSEETLAIQAIKEIRALSERCSIPASLQELEIPESAIQEMAVAALQVQRLLNNNPREVRLEDAVAIYQAAYRGDVS